MPASHPIARAAQFESGQYRPATFLRRGVAVPFTTPHLLGGRIRPGDRSEPELVLANPVGEDGAYVIPWSALPDSCMPTLHDRVLWERIARLPVLAPRTVREAARGVAAEGYAGRPAARAAEVAFAEALQGRTRTQYHLLLELVRQGEMGRETGREAGPPPERESLPALEARARSVLQEPGTGVAPLAAFEALAELAAACSLCGLPGDPTAAPAPALMAAIGALGRDIAAEAGPEQASARLIAQGARLTLRCCRPVLAGAHAALADLPGLLRHWRAAPGAEGRARPGRDRDLALRTARLDWLLDGWDLVCGLWRGAEPARRGLVLPDMAAMVPLLPAELDDWCGADAGFDPGAEREALLAAQAQWRRTLPPGQDGMTGRSLELIARNEGLRAAAA